MMEWRKLLSVAVVLHVVAGCGGKKQDNSPALLAVRVSEDKYSFIKVDSLGEPHGQWLCAPNNPCALLPPCRCPKVTCTLCLPLKEFVIRERLAPDLETLIRNHGVNDIFVVDSIGDGSVPGSGSADAGSAVK